MYAPWHYVWPPDAPPWDFGPHHWAELQLCQERMQTVRGYVEAANLSLGSTVEVGAILLDSELFWIMPDGEPGADEWNDAIDAKYDAIYDIVRGVFPDARIEWYERGAIRRGDCWPTGWCQNPHQTLREQGDTFNVSLYRVPEIGYARETFRRTHALAQTHGVDEVIPWVSLASGYRRLTGENHEWTFDWNYDLTYAWQIGADINDPSYGNRPERYAPWHAASIVVFYPEPFGRAPEWARHFIAYVRGAHAIHDLPTPAE